MALAATGTAAALILSTQAAATPEDLGLACGMPVETEAVLSTLGLEDRASYSHTEPGSTATGAYYFTIGALKALGYIAEAPEDIASLRGDATWEQVAWTGKHGVTSREDFLSTPAVQDCAAREAYSFLARD